MVEKITDDYYCVNIDFSRWNGILHFTKECSVWIQLVPIYNDTMMMVFKSAEVLTPGGFDGYLDYHEFMIDYPELYPMATKELCEYFYEGA